ncbi:GFA family protein [Erythrobacter sp. SDW2]|uniref:GFA family protein n=1 Tax=Erythrobacter sp. SDW2 TaxID=2907154 RepID=UPI001F45FDDC|nr:GFA family protein [Erythrobacter sp. SDW2]UIP07734.1 GFA family protein [Erythrobacter sp. SDW2]
MSDHLQGQCLCGAVRLAFQQERPGIDACHCKMCQQWAGAPLLTLRGIKPEAMTLTGEEHITRYVSSGWAERAFCNRCGSGLWYHFKPGNHICFLAGLFDLPEEYAMREQIFIDEKPGYYSFADRAPAKTGAEVIAEAEAEGFSFD